MNRIFCAAIAATLLLTSCHDSLEDRAENARIQNEIIKIDQKKRQRNILSAIVLHQCVTISVQIV